MKIISFVLILGVHKMNRGKYSPMKGFDRRLNSSLTDKRSFIKIYKLFGSVEQR